jgi:hypothetical protein
VVNGILGEGSSGMVFAACHVETGVAVALKVLRPACAEGDLLNRFRRECELAASLDHPGIVRVLDAGVERGSGLALPFIAYERIDGLPFRAATAARPVADVLRTFAALCDAIDYAHGRGILHRDLKSANVLVDAAGCPHVLDFGIGVMLGDDRQRLTRHGQVMGSLGSMSPEQAASAPVDARSDVYGLGALLFEALTGELPHRLDGLGEAHTLLELQRTPARSLARVLPTADRGLVAVVDAALAFAPADRYPCVAELRADVRRLLRRRIPRVRRPTAWQALRTFARRHRRLAWSLGAVVVASLLLSVGLFFAWVNARAKQTIEQRLRGAFSGLVQIAAELVESVPQSGDEYERVRGMLDQAVGQADSVAAFDDPAVVLLQAQLHELAGDLALRGRNHARAVDCRTAAAAAYARVVGVLADAEVHHARALVKLGDLKQQTHPDAALAAYEAAHVVFTRAASSPGASLSIRDELGWSLERLAGQRWLRGERVETIRMERERLRLAELLHAECPDPLRTYHLASSHSHLVVYASDRSAALGIDHAELMQHAEVGARLAAAAVEAQPNRHAFLVLAERSHASLVDLRQQAGDAAGARLAAVAWFDFARRLWLRNANDDLVAARLLLAAQRHARLQAEHGDRTAAAALVAFAPLLEDLAARPACGALTVEQVASLRQDVAELCR